MNTYEVTVSTVSPLECIYTIDAPTEEIAINMAEEYFAETMLTFEVKEITNNA